jgi:hypothetical protein
VVITLPTPDAVFPRSRTDLDYPTALAELVPISRSAYAAIAGPTSDAARPSPAMSGGPVVEIVGASLAGTACFALTAAGDSVHGLIINQCPREGITSSGASTVVLGNYIGTDPSGTLARANGTSGQGAAVYLGGDEQVGGLTGRSNVISGNL